MKKLLLASLGFALASGSASAADMAVKARPPAPPAWTWTGCYIGGNVGGKWATTNGTVIAGDTPATPGITPAVPGGTETLGSDTAATAIGGGQLGCNYQTGRMVLGFEGDVDGQDWSGNRTLAGATVFPFVPGDSFDVRSRWEASLRARLGYTWDRWMLYVTGGVAWTDVSAGVNFIPTSGFPAAVFSDNTTLVGGTVGGGLEYALAGNWSAGIEGRYTWYGSHTFNGGTVPTIGFPPAGPFAFAPVTQNISVNTGEVMVKLNYRFGGWPISTK